MGNFRNLLIWQKAMLLVTDIYESSKGFPKEEIFGLTSQIRRCAVSIPSNISEGYGRNSNQEFIRYLNISIGSLFELQTQIEIAYNIGYYNEESYTKIYGQTRELEIMTVTFLNKIKTRTQGLST